MTLGFSSDGISNPKNLTQTYFQFCTWGPATIHLKQSGDCESTSEGSFTYFFDICTQRGINNFPSYDPGKVTGWSCFNASYARTLPGDCPVTNKDLCSYLPYFRNFTTNVTYPHYYDCVFNVTNAICNGNGHVYPFEEQRCEMHAGRFCICQGGWHGTYCNEPPRKWIIDFNPAQDPEYDWNIYNEYHPPQLFTLLYGEQTTLSLANVQVHLRLNRSTCKEVQTGTIVHYDVDLDETWKLTSNVFDDLSTPSFSTPVISSPSSSTTAAATTTTTDAASTDPVDNPTSAADNCEDENQNVQCSQYTASSPQCTQKTYFSIQVQKQCKLTCGKCDS